MLGKVRVILRPRVDVRGPNTGDVVRFSDGHNYQYAKVKVAISYQTASNAL